MEVFAAAGMAVLQDYPKYSQDLNAIENAWKFLRDRIAATEPAGRESRAPFCARLRRAVAWVDRHHGQALLKLARNQRQRARGVLALEGGRTRW